MAVTVLRCVFMSAWLEKSCFEKKLDSRSTLRIVLHWICLQSLPKVFKSNWFIILGPTHIPDIKSPFLIVNSLSVCFCDCRKYSYWMVKQYLSTATWSGYSNVPVRWHQVRAGARLLLPPHPDLRAQHADRHPLLGQLLARLHQRSWPRVARVTHCAYHDDAECRCARQLTSRLLC